MRFSSEELNSFAQSQPSPLPLRGGIPIADAMAVLERNGVSVREGPEAGQYILQKGTDLQVLPLQGAVSKQMLIHLADTFAIEIAEFYQRPLPLS